jgi:hypothetical protein
MHDNLFDRHASRIDQQQIEIAADPGVTPAVAAEQRHPLQRSRDGVKTGYRGEPLAR